MANIIWMAIRQITRRKGKSLSFMTTVSIIGIAIGVSALVVVLSVMGGFEKDLRQKIFKGLPHIEVFAKNSMAGFSLQEHALEHIHAKLPQATGMEPFIRADVVAKRKRSLAPVTLLGIDPDLGGKLWGFSEGNLRGSISDLLSTRRIASPILIGEGLAAHMNLDIGDEVHLLNPQAGVVDFFTGGHLSTKFTVTGIFYTDLPRYDSRFAVVSLKDARKFMPEYEEVLDEKEYVTGIAMNIQKPEDVDKVVKSFPRGEEFDIQTWKNVNSSILVALKLEKFTMGAILFLIVIVAAFSISATMMMMVYHRRSQLALLRAIGMSRSQVLSLYLAQGMTIGFLGTLLGLFIGIGLCAALYYFQFIELPSGVYYQQKLPVKFLPLEYAVISLCAWVLSLFAAVYPALIASRQDPGVGLRYM